MVTKWGDAALRAAKAGFDLSRSMARMAIWCTSSCPRSPTGAATSMAAAEPTACACPGGCRDRAPAWPERQAALHAPVLRGRCGLGRRRERPAGGLLKRQGVDVIDCSSGGTLGDSPMDSARAKQYGYQVPMRGKNSPRGRHHDDGCRPHRACRSGRGHPQAGSCRPHRAGTRDYAQPATGRWTRRRNLACDPQFRWCRRPTPIGWQNGPTRASKARPRLGARAWPAVHRQSPQAKISSQAPPRRLASDISRAGAANGCPRLAKQGEGPKRAATPSTPFDGEAEVVSIRAVLGRSNGLATWGRRCLFTAAKHSSAYATAS